MVAKNAPDNETFECECGAKTLFSLIPDNGNYGCVCGRIWEYTRESNELRMLEGPASVKRDICNIRLERIKEEEGS